MTAEAPRPTPGLIASLGVRLWLDRTPTGQAFAALLLTHPLGRREDETPAAIEQRMLGVAEALGAAPAGETVPDAGERITLRPSGLLVHFDDTPHALHVPYPRPSGRFVAELGDVLVSIGLDPLATSAHGAEVDEYITRTTASGRMWCAAARVAGPPRALP